METTAKVDIRKLQLLNDRIAQTIEALNQVRLSVHGLGLSHTAGVWNGSPFQTSAYPFQAAFQGGLPFQQHPFQSVVPGLSHTAYGYPPVNPIVAAQLWGQSPWQPGSIGVPGMMGGLGHTSPADIYGSAYGYPTAQSAYGTQWLDPITAVRVAQSFPFAQMPISPIQP